MPVAALPEMIRGEIVNRSGRWWRPPWLHPRHADRLILRRPLYLAGLKRSSVKSWILDALLLTSVFLDALKAGDLLLRRGRQRGLPDVVDRLVRRLELARPLDQFRRL